jgi:uncharacterized protein YodC (DUF2158 family)
MIPGDIVTLKSGGPRMTVTALREGDSGTIVFCKWFDDIGQLHTERFALPALMAEQPHRMNAAA